MKNASHKVWKILKIHSSIKNWVTAQVFHLLTQGQIFRVPRTAWLVMCNQETLTIKQWLLLHKAGVPHFNFFQVTGQLRIEDDYYAMSVLHQSWPVCFKPWKTDAWKMVRVIAEKQKHPIKHPQVFFSPPWEHISVLFLYYNITNLASDLSYSKYFDLAITLVGPIICWPT